MKIVNGYEIKPYADLRGADLSFADLSYADLTGVKYNDATVFPLDFSKLIKL